MILTELNARLEAIERNLKSLQEMLASRTQIIYVNIPYRLHEVTTSDPYPRPYEVTCAADGFSTCANPPGQRAIAADAIIEAAAKCCTTESMARYLASNPPGQRGEAPATRDADRYGP